MTMFYPNDLDVYGFCPLETGAECGDWVTDANTGIMAKVSLVSPKSIERSEGKAVRVIDRRKLYV